MTTGPLRYHVSETAGFIHVFDGNDYSPVVKTLAVPAAVVVGGDVLAAYMSDEKLPSASFAPVVEADILEKRMVYT